MKRWFLLALCATPILAGSSFLACGGGDDSVASGGGDGGDDGTVAGDDGGGGGGGDDGGGGGGNDGAGNDGSKGDGGAGGGSNPGQVSCGTATCSLASQFCCSPFVGDAGLTCRDAGASCNGVDLNCDETADCDAGTQCCFEPAATRTRCRDNCNGPGRYVECKSNSECGDAGTCTQHSCQGNLTVKTCKKPPGCN